MARRTETKLDEQLVPFFRRVALIILSVIAFITLLSRFGVDVSAFVATLGIGSLRTSMLLAIACSRDSSDLVIGSSLRSDVTPSITAVILSRDSHGGIIWKKTQTLALPSSFTSSFLAAKRFSIGMGPTTVNW